MPVIEETADAAGNAQTSYTMAVGDTFHGTLETGLASDWVAVTLAAGQTYSFAMTGLDATSLRTEDPYLRLRDANGALVSESDDDGPGRNSWITHTATSGGTYYIDAQTWSTSPGGRYGLSVTAGDRPSFDIDMAAGNLLREGVSWAGGPGSAVTISWGIRATGPAYDANGLITPYITPSAAQITAITQAMALFDGVSGLSLTQVNPGGTTNSATMLFGAYDSLFDGAGAYAYFPGSGADAGDVWLNNDSVSTTSVTPGTYSFFTILHEIGHAIGLDHPGDYNAAFGTQITYGSNAQYIQDSHQYTVMSYFDEDNTTGDFGSYPDTLLLHDLYALHQLYGADMSYHAGNSTYGFNAAGVGGVYDFTTNSDPFLSIWDGGGVDTLDLSGFGQNQRISLVEGSFSNVGGMMGNLSIAIGAVIEHAIGGTGNDTLVGNAAENRLTGGAGQDVLWGNQGDDTLFGGQGLDSLFGGAENDRLDGQAGEDRLFGQDGDDWIFGNLGHDTLLGGDGDDQMLGGWSNDWLYAGEGDDWMLGEGGIDRLFGQNGNDWMSGGGQNDTAYGGDGDDTLLGGNGADLLQGGGGHDWLYGGDDDDLLRGEAGIDRLFGQGGDNTLEGGSGTDTLYGGAGNDSLLGGADADMLDAGSGNDTLTGGAGGDRFVFNTGFGVDRITDFETGTGAERIDLSGVAAITDLTDLIDNHMTQAGADVVINAGGGNTITVEGVSLAALSDGNDFLF